MGRKRKIYITAECRRKAKNGDKTAMNAIIDHYMLYIKKLCNETMLGYTGSRRSDLEEDITQELITELIRGSRNFREEHHSGAVS